jgi:hypothetical protein
MAVSGKGGWSEDQKDREKYAKSTNVTLLDHLLSMARGALMLAALDWLGRNPEMNSEVLKHRLRVIAVLAFLHDLDKIIGLERDTALPLTAVEEALQQYGLAAFLAGGAIILSADQIRYLIEKVEASQSFRNPPAALPPRESEVLTGYVALADKLDGIWLASDPINGGLKGMLKRLKEDQTLHIDLLRQWRPLEIFDPHHPFLLDELHRWLSDLSLRLTGVPPLVEVHQDGRLFMLLPETGFADIVAKAISSVCRQLPFQLELNISNRGLPELLNGQPDHAELQTFIEALPARELGRLLLLKAELKESLTPKLDALLGNLGLAPRWPKISGALITSYASLDDMGESARSRLKQAAHLVLLLNLNLPAGKKTGLPDYADREQSLLKIVNRSRPDWIEAIEDNASRRVITALWVLAVAETDRELEAAIWGEFSLLKHWLEGTGAQPGFNRFIRGRGAQVVASVERHFQQLLSGQRVRADNEDDRRRCLFTDQPVPFDDSIDEALGLYEVKISAFSGRDNRPETLASERAQTHVSSISTAEHKLRAQAHERQGGKAEGVATLISSPATLGLFGGLGMTSDAAMRGLSIYDLSRQEMKKGTVYYGLEGYRGAFSHGAV